MRHGATKDSAGHAPVESDRAMSESKSNLPSQSLLERYTQLRETVERAPEQRPTADRIDAIAEWLVGPAPRLVTAAEAFDEFSWRMLATGLPLLRVTMHGGTLHPQFLGAALIWWRTTGRTELRMITHEVRELERVS